MLKKEYEFVWSAEVAQQQFYLRNRGTRALRQRDGWVTTRGSRQRGPPCARAVTRVTDDVSSSKRARESRTQPRIDDGRGSSDGGDPARCAGGLVHLRHLGGRRERASNAKTSKPRKLYHSLYVFCTPGRHAEQH